MPPNGMREFKEVLKNFKELGALAIKGTVAAPLLNLWAKIGPPPSATISMLTSVAQFLAVMWAFHFWQGSSVKALNRRMKGCAVVFCASLLFSGIMIQQFTSRPAPDRDLVVHGYLLRPEIQKLIGPSYRITDALRDAEFDPFQVWTGESILITHTLLVLSWMGAFVSIGIFVSLFVIVQRKRRVN